MNSLYYVYLNEGSKVRERMKHILKVDIVFSTSYFCV